MELILYRQTIGGEWKLYRHSGFQSGQWKLVLRTCDEGVADLQYRKIYEKLRQGGLRLIDPEGVVVRDFFSSPMTHRWGKRYEKPKKTPKRQAEPVI